MRGAHVQSAAALDTLRIAVRRCRDEAQVTLDDARESLQKARDDLREACRDAAAEVDHYVWAVDDARADLSRCLVHGDDDELPDCSYEHQAVQAARAALAEAKARRRRLEAAEARLEQDARPFEAGTYRMDGFLQEEVPRWEAFIEARIKDVERYGSVRLVEAAVRGAARTAEAREQRIRRERGVRRTCDHGDDPTHGLPFEDPLVALTPKTHHGAIRLLKMGWTWTELRRVVETGKRYPQAGEAQVFILEVEEDRFSFVVEGRDGIISCHKRVRRKRLANIAKNQGWRGFP